MVFSCLSALILPGLSSDSPLFQEVLWNLSCWVRRPHPLHPTISALVSLGHHCLKTSLFPPLDCESRSPLGPQHWADTKQMFWGRNDFRTPGGTSVLWRRNEEVPSLEQGSKVPTPPPLTMAVSPSSTTSKLHVSVALSKSGVKGGTLSRRLSQSRPKKKGCFWKSPAPFRPRRISRGHSSCWMRSRASSGTPASASGRDRCSCSEGEGKKGCYLGACAERLGFRALLTL